MDKSEITLEEAIICARYVDLLYNEIKAENPSRVALLAARYLLTKYDRELLPDWIALIAGGDLDVWDQVVEEARIEISIEENFYDSLD